MDRTHIMKKALIVFRVGLIALGVMAADPVFAQTSTLSDRIVAKVNQDMITMRELDTQVAKIEARHPQDWPSDVQQQHKMVLQMMVNRKLQLDLAEKMGLTVSKKDVDTAIQSFAKRQSKTTDQLRAEVEGTGETWKAYQIEMKDELLMAKVQSEAVNAQIHLNQSEIKSTMADMQKAANAKGRAFDILDVVIDDQDAKTAAKQKALADDLLEGLEADPNAQSHLISKYHQTALGWRTVDALPSIFVSALKNKHAGSIAGPVVAPNGVHILIVQGVRGEPVTITEAQARGYLYGQAYGKALNEWMTKLRKEAYIDITL